jgi:pentatricopeptide repeat protein
MSVILMIVFRLIKLTGLPPKLKMSRLHSRLTVALSLMPSHRPHHSLSLYFILFKPNLTTYLKTVSRRFFSNQSWLSVRGNPLIKWPPLPHHAHCAPPHPIPTANPNQNPDPDFSQNDFSTISNLLTDPNISPGPALEAALDGAGVEPGPALLHALFNRFDSSPKLLHTLFVWAEKQPGFQSPATLFNSMINILAKSKKFDSAWSLVLDRVALVSGDTFAIIIRRYTRAGIYLLYCKCYKIEFAIDLPWLIDSNWAFNLS